MRTNFNIMVVVVLLEMVDIFYGFALFVTICGMEDILSLLDSVL